MNAVFFRSATARLVFSLLPLFVIVSSVEAQFNYTTTGGAITITGYTGPGGNVGIPSAINGVPVVAIGSQSFYSQTSLTGLVISNGVASVGSYAFYGCANLTNVIIPNSITNIGDKAFESCSSLTSVTLPGSVTNLGDVPFYLCTALTAINVASTNPAYSSFTGVLFNKSQTTLLEGPGAITGNYVVPSNVTNISDNAFWGCSSLTGITIPKGVVDIEGGALGFCGSLASLNIPSTATNIGVWAFYGCSNLTAIVVDTNNPAYASTNGVLFDRNHTTLIQYPAGSPTNSYAIPNGVTSVAQSAFSYSGNLTNVTFSPSVTDIGDEAFEYCTSLATVVVPNTVTNLGYQAFYYCGSLTSATLGNGVTSIDLETFANCVSLNHVVFGNSLTNIGEDAFYYCYNLTSLNLPNSLVTIGDQAFSVLFYLQQLTLPASLVNIGDYAFQDCGLTNLTIPAGVTNIGSSVFQSCSSLVAINVATNNPAYSSRGGVLFDRNQTTLIRYPAGLTTNTYVMPNGVTSIAQGAFTISPYLNNVICPDSLTSLGQFAFAGCNGLTTITLPASITNLDAYAFSACPNLVGVYCYGNAPSVTPQSFYSDTTTVYYLPGTTGWSTTLAGEATALWTLPYPLILANTPSFGIQTNRFGFVISWATNRPVVVQSCTNLARPVWVPLVTNTLASGTSYFSDTNGTKAPARFYRIASQ